MPFLGYMPKMLAGAVEVSLDEAFESDLSGIDAVMTEDLQAVFDAGAAVGDLGEVVSAELLSDRRSRRGSDRWKRPADGRARGRPRVWAGSSSRAAVG